MNDTGRLIVVTGPPGAGKTTVAHLMVDSLAQSVHLHSDDFWGFIKKGGIAPYLPEAHQQNTTVITALARASVAYAEGGYDVVLDGVVGPWFLHVFREESARRNVPLHYAVLRPDEVTTVERAVSRGNGALTDPAPVRSLHHQFSDIAEYERHVCDSTHLTPSRTAEIILDRIEQGETLLRPPEPPRA